MKDRIKNKIRLTINKATTDTGEVLINTKPPHSCSMLIPSMTDPTKQKAQLQNKGVYEPDLTKMFVDKIRPTDVCVDVGACWGYYTLLFSEFAKRVFAFEPHPDSFRILKKNVTWNHCKNVSLIRAGLSNMMWSGPILLYGVTQRGSDTLHPEHIVEHGLKVDKVHKVRLVTLKEHVVKVDVIKVDVEGHELQVFEGMEYLFATNPPRIIVFECFNKKVVRRILKICKLGKYEVKRFGNNYWLERKKDV